MVTKKGVASCTKAVKRNRRGKGLLNKVINKLPVELHILGYQYCGPGTKLRKRLSRGDPGINPLDTACKEHHNQMIESIALGKGLCLMTYKKGLGLHIDSQVKNSE